MLNQTDTDADTASPGPVRVSEATRIAGRRATEMGLPCPEYYTVWRRAFGLTEGSGKAVCIPPENLPELWRRLRL